MSSPSEKPTKPVTKVPDPELNPMSNPLLARNMGRWAEVYFTNPPEKREQAVQELLRELKDEQPPAVEEPVAVAAPAPPPQTPSPQPVSALVTDEQFATCPACLHKNLTRQRFCGLCGFPLHSEDKPADPPKAEPPPPAEAPGIERTEHGWEWLREKNLAEFHASSSEPRRGWQFVLVPLAVLLAAILIYFVVTQSQSKISHKENPPSPASSSQSVSAVPSSSSAPEARPATSRESENSTEHRSRDERLAKVTDENSGSSGASSATPEKDDGEHELAEARRYLDGTGVPKNTAIASTWLWKAVSKQNSEAVLLLSDLYARGDGVPKSCAQAQILLSAEARRGSPAASQKLADINNSVCR